MAAAVLRPQEKQLRSLTAATILTESQVRPIQIRGLLQNRTSAKQLLRYGFSIRQRDRSSLTIQQVPGPSESCTRLLTRKSSPLRSQTRAEAARRRDDRLSERITGWAVNALFPMRDVPNLYRRLPWHKIWKARGLIRGTLFVVEVLAVWPFEITRELIWSRDAVERD
jgi:hypothetical protein